jgi:signal transduction histidine kinase
LRWIAQTVGDKHFAAQVARPDPAGRLRAVATLGPRSTVGRKRSARRRAAFESGEASLTDLAGAGSEGLLFLPLIARGETLGVVEIQAPIAVLRERMGTLRSIASQTAIVLRGIGERARLERERDARADTLELAAELVTLSSPVKAVERIVVYCHRRFHVPIAGWLSDGAGSPFRLIATRGLRGAVRTSFWHDATELPSRSELNEDVWQTKAERYVRAIADRQLTWLDAGKAVFLVAGSGQESEELLPCLRSILPGAIEHLDVMAAAERRDRSLDTALAWTAHEFRTPLMSVHARLQSLIRNGLLPEDHAGLLNQSSKELTDLGELVESLLRWSAGDTFLHRQPLDLVEFIRTIVETEMGSESGRIVILGPESLRIRADPLQLRSAMANLIRNALMYSDPGSKVRIVMHQGDETASVTVLDEGPGVPSEEMGKIFDPFVRARVTGRTRKGRGLGLFVAQRVVQAHGGTIWAESTPRGARFHVHLPLSSARARSSVS